MIRGYKTMMVRVLGIGFRKTGEKYGKKYDFVPMCIAFENAKKFEGEDAREILMDGEIFEAQPISVGDCLELSYYWYKDKNGVFQLNIVGVI